MSTRYQARLSFSYNVFEVVAKVAQTTARVGPSSAVSEFRGLCRQANGRATAARDVSMAAVAAPELVRPVFLLEGSSRVGEWDEREVPRSRCTTGSKCDVFHKPLAPNSVNTFSFCFNAFRGPACVCGIDVRSSASLSGKDR